MNGVHDMGGMHGLGPIEPEADEPVFHERWEASVLAMTLAVGAWGRWTLDESRFTRESIPGPQYLRMSYYEKWFAGTQALALKHGLITTDELETSRPAAGAAKATPPLTGEQVSVRMAHGGPTQRDIAAKPAFAVGDSVRARNINPTGHTRLPRYARGHVGVIARHHGAHVFPDTNAHGGGEQPRHLYQVRFAARELWGEAAAARDAVFIDLWEPYLEPA